LSLSVGPGEIVAIVGESGSGKSMTALSVLGLAPSAATTTGRIVFAGCDLRGLCEKELARVRGDRIGMVFQEPMTSLNPVLTVGEQVAETLRWHRHLDRRAARTKAIELLTSVGIAGPAVRAGQYPHQMSGGMRQRAMIAIALACGPQLLIADEPTTALDVTVQAQIIALLKQLQRELELAILLITHDLGVVAQMAQRVVVMYAGRKVEEGKVQDVLVRPRHPYTQALLAAVPRLGGTANEAVPSRLVEMPPALRGAVTGDGCAFASRCGHAVPACQEVWPGASRWAEGHVAFCHAIEAGD
jgi:peptide/nickel transport system ATP-binding protein